MRFTDLNVGSLSNDDSVGNESAKKAIGRGSVYMEGGGETLVRWNNMLRWGYPHVYIIFHFQMRVEEH